MTSYPLSEHRDHLSLGKKRLLEEKFPEFVFFLLWFSLISLKSSHAYSCPTSVFLSLTAPLSSSHRPRGVRPLAPKSLSHGAQVVVPRPVAASLILATWLCASQSGHTHTSSPGPQTHTDNLGDTGNLLSSPNSVKTLRCTHLLEIAVHWIIALIFYLL